MSPLVISIAAFLGVAGLIAAIAVLFSGDKSGAVEDRLAILAGKKAAPSEQISVSRELMMREGMTGLAGFMRSMFERFSNLRLLFVQADLPMKPETFLALIMGMAIAGVGIGVMT